VGTVCVAILPTGLILVGDQKQFVVGGDLQRCFGIRTASGGVNF